jgi:hypothetical protein
MAEMVVPVMEWRGTALGPRGERKRRRGRAPAQIAHCTPVALLPWRSHSSSPQRRVPDESQKWDKLYDDIIVSRVRQ